MQLCRDKTVLLGVSGGIAAYRSCELARLLVKDGARVQVVMTEAAAELVGPLTFQALTGRPVEVGRGGKLAASGMAHIDLGRDSQLIIIAPATGNTLAKLAHGLADNLLTSSVLASTCPVLLAPAMNTRMWKNELTRRNMKILSSLKRFQVVGPASGQLACGEEGTGRMSEPAELFQASRCLLGPGSLSGRRLLVTAGPTHEPIDPVRVIANRSSGKMGYALARAARRRGARVCLISGPTSLTAPWDVELVAVETAAQMARQVSRRLAGSDVLIMTAAVADYAPSRPARKKLKKAGKNLTIELQPTTDILAAAGKRKHRPLLVGFAAETGSPLGEARRKLADKNLDMIVANDVGQAGSGFGSDDNQVHILGRGQDRVDSLPLLPKQEVAEQILDRVERLLPGRRTSSRKRG